MSELLEPIPPQVCVVVSHMNSKRTIGTCLDNLLKQEYPSERFEIIVVDAGSSDGSIDIVDRLKCRNLSQIIAPGCSEAAGQNLGIAASKSDVIMLTNSDIYVPHDWIKKHVRWLNGEYDLVGGKVFWGGDKITLTWNMPKPDRPQFVQRQGMGLGFSNCSFRRSLLSHVGGIRDISSQHDNEFAFRVLKSGGKMVLDPSIEVYHDHPFRSLRGSFLRAFGYMRNSAIIMRSTFGRIVLGSNVSAALTLGYLFKEFTLFYGVKTYYEVRPEAYEREIKVGLLEFVLTRLFVTKLGQFLGAFVGAVQGQASFSTVDDLHRHISSAMTPGNQA